MSRIAIVTVTYNSEAVLPDFLNSVWKQTHRDFLLYVIDSGSADGTQEYIRRIDDPRLRIILLQENIGFAAGSNLGIKTALEQGCDAVMLLNNDTVFGSDLLQGLVDGMERYACDMTAPKMLYHDEPNRIWAAGGHLNRWIGYRNRHDGENRLDDGNLDRPQRVTYVPFCCVLMRSSIFTKIGCLDETYFVYMEDVDYCFRALKANLSIWYLPECKLWHKTSSLTGGVASSFSIRFGTRNRVYYMLKNLPLPASIFWIAIYAISSCAKCLIGKKSRINLEIRLSALYEGAKLGWEKGRTARFS